VEGPAVSNVGKWDRWFAAVTVEEPFADTETYRLGADFLAGCPTVEDWGCGKGWFRRVLDATCFERLLTSEYRGVDGSASPFADIVVDLTRYMSEVDGIFMRHVLEHNYEWRTILANAVASFRRRMVLVLFTPLAEETHEITFAADPGVPDIAFAEKDLVALFGDARWSRTDLATASQYGTETVFFLDRP
jgi:hypothetical protein